MRIDEDRANAVSPSARSLAPRTTRRKLLSGAALATGAVVVDAAARAVPARAADGDPVTLGQLNTETQPTVIVNQHQGLLEDNTGLEVTAGGPVGIGVIATGSASGVQGLGSGANADGVAGIAQGGTGVLGQSTTGVGVFGDSTGGGVGVYGTIENGGIGVRAEGGGLGPGTALEVLGVATFSRSGLASVPAGSNQVTVTGVSINGRPASMILALVQLANGQGRLAGKIWATSAFPVLGGNQFTIYLNTKAPVSIQVAWFVLG